MLTSIKTATVAVVLVTLTGCAGEQTPTGAASSTPTTPTSAASSPSASPTPTTTPSPTDSVTVIEVEIHDGRVTPSPSRRVQVDQGDTVRIVLTSDQADEVHVHGYDLEEPVRAGGTATVEFIADQTGSFEVEAHVLDPPLLFTLQVT